MIVCLSASHKNTSLPMLESLTFRKENEAAKNLCSESFVQECVLLQTCHRVEIYCVVKDSIKDEALRRVLRLWSTEAGVSLDLLSRIVEIYQGRDSLKHLFFLSSGLESVVVGEDQVLGQVRTAYVKAKKNGTVGLVLDKVFMKAVNLGRSVRTKTEINEGSVSISSAAVDFAAKELGDLRDKKCLVIGAGEAASIAAETLRRRGVKSILVANRTHEKGEELASKVMGKAVKFDGLHSVVPKVDLVIAAVSVAKPILERKQLETAFGKSKRSKELLLVDISQPRSIEEEVGTLQRVSLRNIDDLKVIVDESLRNRQDEAEKVKKIIFDELEEFERQLSRLSVEPVINEIYRKIESIRRRELERAASKLGETDAKKLAVLDRFSRELVERVLQTPIEQLREMTLDENNALLLAVEKLFQVKRQDND